MFEVFMRKQLLQCFIGLAFLLTACPFSFSAEDEKDPASDYKKVDKALVPQIQKMAAGEIKGPVSVPWRLFVPPQASAANPLPIVFMLHGAGRRGNDNVGPMDLAYSFWSEEAQKKNPCFVLAPQCRKGAMWVPALTVRRGIGGETPFQLTDIMTLLATRSPGDRRQRGRLLLQVTKRISH
ncbi:MAG TPA: hypothetical protein VK968_11965 [Roseimicrobium sp.]|nr:hypothetical protein [Roseimicrobium sp.]